MNEPRNIFRKPTTPDFIPAPNLKRIAAVFIDSVIILTASSLIMGVLSGLLYHSSPYKEVINFIIQGLFLTPAYWVGLSYYYGATPGKKMLGLLIVGERFETNLSLKTFIMRECVWKWLSTIVLGLGYLWAFFREDRRTWHDLLGKTRVVEVPKKVAG